MTNDALLVVQCLFQTIWKLFNSWYIPGTNVTPAVLIFGFLFLGICFRFIGHFFGRRIIQSGKVKALTPERLAKTEGMIEKWGPLAVFLGRFFPFIRTFMPFISGISGMRWSRFTPFSVLGGLCWSTLFTLLGYFFGNIPAVQDHFELVIVLILLVSLAPTIIGLLKAKFGKKKPAKVTDAQLDVMEDGIKNLDK